MAPRRRNPAAIERDARAVELRRQHLSYRQIAAALGVSHQAAYEAVHRGLTDMYQEPADEVRRLELERLDELAQAAQRVRDTIHYAVDHGRIVEHPDTGEPLIDDGPVISAIETLLRIQNRRAKLLGLDAPVKAEVRHVDSFDADIAALVAELASRSQGPAEGHPEVLPVAAEGPTGPTTPTG